VSRVLPCGLWKASRLAVEEVLCGLIFASGQLRAELPNLALIDELAGAASSGKTSCRSLAARSYDTTLAQRV
jgi:hypothetical protein